MQTIDKAKKIRLLILDLDGVLTSGIIYYGNQDIEIKGFHIHDGLGLKMLMRQAIEVAVISAKRSQAVERRLNDLKIKHIFLGHETKLPIYEELKKQLNLNNEQIAYMGDDLPDLPILRRVGLSLTVPAAPDIIKQHAHYITRKKAGKGAVREVCELILKAQEKFEHVLQFYLDQ